MKMLLSAGAASLILVGFCGGIDAPVMLPLEQAIGLAEKGDARGLYSLSINLAYAGSAANGLEDVRWLRCSAGKFLLMAEEAGSADAIFLLGALAERKLYADIRRTSHSGGLLRHTKRANEEGWTTDGAPEGCPVSALPAIDMNVASLPDSARSYDVEWPWDVTTRNASGPLLAGVRRPGTEIKLKQVYHSDSKTVCKYNLCGLTNDVIKAYVRSHYLKARELGVQAAEEALSRFKTNCLRMVAILEAMTPKEKNARDVRNLLNVTGGAETVQREAERAEQWAQLRAIQDELKRKRESKKAFQESQEIQK